MKITERKTRRMFSHAYILGGSPCSGKSTIAERLSREFKLQYYKVDDHEREHSKRCDPDRHPTMCKYANMSWNEIWMRPVPHQVIEEFEYYRERFEMIIQDLGNYDWEKPLIFEGAAYLPELIEQNRADRKRVVFMVPTKAFQLHHYRQRPWIQHILTECEDPDRAFDNWMKRDYQFGREILRQANERDYKTILVDGSQTKDEQFERVKKYLGLK